MLWVLFEKMLSLYFDWPKSWIWQTLGHVMDIFWKWHFYNASKEVFWQKIFWISCNFLFCQNGTFEPIHEIKDFLWPKDIFWSIMKSPYPKNIYKMLQGPPNQGFRLVKVQTEDFFRIDLRYFKFLFYFGFLFMNPQLAWKTKL